MKKYRYYQQVGFKSKDGDLHDSIIIKRLPKTGLKREFIILDIETSQVHQVKEDEIMMDLAVDIDKINFLISGPDFSPEERFALFNSVIETDYPYYWEIRDILWQRFLREGLKDEPQFSNSGA